MSTKSLTCRPLAALRRDTSGGIQDCLPWGLIIQNRVEWHVCLLECIGLEREATLADSVPFIGWTVRALTYYPPIPKLLQLLRFRSFSYEADSAPPICVGTSPG